MKKAARKAQGAISRDAVFLPATLDETARTVEVVAATETPVPRFYGDEILRCDAASVDIGRMMGLPVLDSHDRSSILSTLGRVENWRFENRQLIAVFRFADNERGRDAFGLVKDGMIRKVSVGYRILAEEEARSSKGATTITATKWEPYEISLVAVPADPNANIRGINMARKNKAVEEIEELDDNEENQRAAESVTRQIDEVRAQVRAARFDEDEIEEAFEGIRTISEARRIGFEMLATRSRETDTTPSRRNDRDQSSEIERQVIDALAIRMGGNAAEGFDNPLRERSLTDIGRAFFQAAGVRLRSSDDASIADFMTGQARAGWASGMTRAYHTTSDFPSLLVEGANRALLDRFGVEASPLKALARKRNARDFRAQKVIRPGEAPKLLKIPQSGEVKSGSIEEAFETFAVETYGRMFALSRKSLINDDLGAFSDFIGAFAESAITTEGDLLFELLSQNTYNGQTMADGKALFHVDHGNKAGTPSIIDVDNLDLGFKAMRTQKNINGTGTAGAVPAVLLVGPAKEVEARKAVASITPTTSSDVNPFSGKLRVEVENRYSGNGWWLFAEPQTRPALAYGYLDGREGPAVESQSGWETLGMQFRCLLDFGCAALDWRAAYFNAGA